jgi:hypothetical protein
MKHHTKFWHLLTGLLPILLGVWAVGGLLLGAQLASAEIQGPQFCIQPNSGLSKLNCTANDVRIAGVAKDAQGNFLITPTTCDPNQNGGKFDLTATFQVVTTASERYDIGIYFDIRGDTQTPPDGARTGLCSLSKLPIPPALDLEGGGDTCGDTVQNTNPLNPLLVTISIPGVSCVGDTFVKLPNCTSWAQNKTTLCTTDAQAKPGTTSKCSCDDAFTIPVLIQRGELVVAKDASPTQLDEPGGSVDYTVTVTNTGVGTVTLTTIVDDPDNDPSSDNSITYQASVICGKTVLQGGQTPGDSTTCTFTRTVSGNAGQSFTDKACVNGTDPGGAVGPTCDTASVSIKDVLPTATVAKSLVGLQCADVRYHVKVTNTDAAEALSLTALTDLGFGDITTVHDDVLGTTCGVASGIGTLTGQTGAGTLPAPVAVNGGLYECDFDAHFCGSSHQDTVNAALSDNDGNAITPSSNTLTVNVSATTP